MDRANMLPSTPDGVTLVDIKPDYPQDGKFTFTFVISLETNTPLITQDGFEASSVLVKTTSSSDPVENVIVTAKTCSHRKYKVHFLMFFLISLIENTIASFSLLQTRHGTRRENLVLGRKIFRLHSSILLVCFITYEWSKLLFFRCQKNLVTYFLRHL